MSASIEAWLKKAEHDLKSAKTLNEADLLDTAIYHTQQTAEKALKAFIIYKTKSFSKTHDLRRLIMIAANIDRDFNQFIDYAEELTPYAVEFRYPTEWPQPDKSTVLEAIKMAEEIFIFIKCKLNI
ncbi:HEPN domain-containing protein [Orenia metallireducens]|jgi:HEPN domain-containing protein|uniref:HEPN domain-containing protein n=1 Tax=Orenia metallireducens TaxID=1413210 RepID=A0A285IDJ1_9FIRM|nr:HEPN domain-containing protein [Orenia metallireducens]PRX19658.1 HEPN domain-containing protein [Orenia metallireducens]SNY46039.1 HEPN domain-containing protein [Orenia metallireducens]